MAQSGEGGPPQVGAGAVARPPGGPADSGRAPTPVMLKDLLGSRKPVVGLRIVREGGQLRYEPQLDAGREKGEALRQMVSRVFAQGRDRLSQQEWDRLLEPHPGGADDRWALLARLATTPVGKEGKLLDQFVALPDGTPFSVRLLLLEARGGDRQGRGGDRASGFPRFGRLPDAVKLWALARALERERDAGEFRTDAHFAGLLEGVPGDLKLGVAPPQGEDVSRLRAVLKKKGGEDLFPKRSVRRRHRAMPGDAGGEEPAP